MKSSKAVPRAPYVYPMFRNGKFVGYQAQARIYQDRFTVAVASTRYFNVADAEPEDVLKSASRWVQRERRKLEQLPKPRRRKAR